jgi:hypothetical protein
MDMIDDNRLSLDEALAEPIVRLMMAADGLSEDDVRTQMLAVASLLSDRRAQTGMSFELADADGTESGGE